MGRPLKRPREGRTCEHPGCSRPLEYATLCGMHYYRKVHGCDMDAPPQHGHGKPKVGVEPCSVPGCDRKYRAKGLCSLHYSRQSATGKVGPVGPLREPGSIVKSKTGYLYERGKAVHRTVMEAMIGRKLLPGETPHHKNGIRDDNRPENLELWVKPQLPGQRVEDLVAFVVENYPEAVEAALSKRPQLRLVS